MNTSGEVADLMVKEGIQITESAAKLAGLGAKNLAAIIMALLKDESRMQGKTNLKQLLKSDKPLCILQIKEADLKKFNSEAKKYGVLFTAVSDRANDTGLCDIIAKQEDVTKLNYRVENLGCAVPKREQPEQKQEGGDIKKQNPRARSEHRYTKRGDTERADRNIKSSVRDKITQIKAERSIGKTSGIERTAAKKGRDVSR